jgi:3-oxoacyl-[acyl-carrier protein] reductase
MSPEPSAATGDGFAARAGAALVLGASGGLGAAIAAMLFERGSRVAGTFRRPGSARIAQLLAHGEAVRRGAADGPAVRAYQLDLTDAARCAQVVEEVVADFGGLHTLVHAAGPHVPMLHLSRVTPRQFQEQLVEDAAGFFNVIHPALPHLRRGAGNVVCVTTAATRRFPVRDGLSAGPKGAVEAIVRGLAAEEGRYGVRANCVGPGMLTDGMAERLIASGDLDERALAVARGNIPLRRFGSALDIAEAVCFLASDRAAFVSGQKLDVDGGYGA